jgi:hypothetical protein
MMYTINSGHGRIISMEPNIKPQLMSLPCEEVKRLRVRDRELYIMEEAFRRLEQYLPEAAKFIKTLREDIKDLISPPEDKKGKEKVDTPQPILSSSIPPTPILTPTLTPILTPTLTPILTPTPILTIVPSIQHKFVHLSNSIKENRRRKAKKGKDKLNCYDPGFDLERRKRWARLDAHNSTIQDVLRICSNGKSRIYASGLLAIIHGATVEQAMDVLIVTGVLQ